MDRRRRAEIVDGEPDFDECYITCGRNTVFVLWKWPESADEEMVKQRNAMTGTV